MPKKKRIEVKTQEQQSDFDTIQEFLINQVRLQFYKTNGKINVYLPDDIGFSICFNRDGTWELE